MLQEIERVKADFVPDLLQNARAQTWKVIETVVPLMKPGMLETQAKAIVEDTMKQMGVERFWHRTHVRFGANTLKTFSDEALPGVRLQSDDIFFFDLGPVWQGYEGDCGATFTVGNDPEMQRCARDSKEIFRLVRNRWMETGESGTALYQFSQGCAKERGWEFIVRGASGHRISDFPHRLYSNATLVGLAERPSAERWILEVQLRHPSRMFGAFFEDVLD